MSTRSPMSRVFSIEADGMKKAWIAKVLMTQREHQRDRRRAPAARRQKLRRRLAPASVGTAWPGAAGCIGAVRRHRRCPAPEPGSPCPGCPCRRAGPGIEPRPGIAWVSSSSGTGSAGSHGGDPKPSRAPEPLIRVPLFPHARPHRRRSSLERIATFAMRDRPRVANGHLAVSPDETSCAIPRDSAPGSGARRRRQARTPRPGRRRCRPRRRAARPRAVAACEPRLLECIRDGQVTDP